MVFTLALALVLAIASAQTCSTDGSEYLVSDVLFGCSAAWGYSEITVVDNQEFNVMYVPMNVVNLNFTLTGDVDVDIMVKDATSIDVIPMPCIVGPMCEIQSEGTWTYESMTIVYSGDSTNPPVNEYVYIPYTDRQLAYTVKARGTGNAMAYYEYDGVEPCAGTSGGCAPCEDYTGCKQPYVANCDGSSDVQCTIPTMEPTEAPTMSEFEILYRECSKEIINLETQITDYTAILDMCDEKGIVCTSTPSTTPTKTPSNDPSQSPTGSPSPSPTPQPTDPPLTSSPTPQPTESPSDYPSWSPTCECYDLIPSGEEKWYDALGPDYDCEWYKNDPHRFCSNDAEFMNFDLSSKDACCICRGGSCAEPTFAPSTSPTSSPTGEPSQTPTDSPTTSPSNKPTPTPTLHPSKSPTPSPTTEPSASPESSIPTRTPSDTPSENPTKRPTTSPTDSPTTSPSETPSKLPSLPPTKTPTSPPTENPTPAPTTQPPTSPPTLPPTHEPTFPPSTPPTTSPTTDPTMEPTQSPSTSPTPSPTTTPSGEPSMSPTCECKDLIPPGEERWVDNYGVGYGCDWYAIDSRFCSYDEEHYRKYGLVAKEACCICGGGSCNTPTMYPSFPPTPAPTEHPLEPTEQPTQPPTDVPSLPPSKTPTVPPTDSPTDSPSTPPSEAPTCECYDLSPPGEMGWYDAGGEKYNCDWYESDPERHCAFDGERYRNFGATAQEACCVCGAVRCAPPTNVPTLEPTKAPTDNPSPSPTGSPSPSPTQSPTESPSKMPTPSPSPSPTPSPTDSPSDSPTPSPSDSPTPSPTDSPSPSPTPKPSDSPTPSPTPSPSLEPSMSPTPKTDAPTVSPTDSPSPSPTPSPSPSPTERPTHPPSPSPTEDPSVSPSQSPTPEPTPEPTMPPTVSPSRSPACDPCYDLIPADSPGYWHDAYGYQYDCAFYERDPWRFCVYDAEVYESFGFVAKDACCVCGGGSCAEPTFSPTNSPTPSPTGSPSEMPTKPPTESPTLPPTTELPSPMPTVPPTPRPTHDPSPSPTTPPSNTPTPPPSPSPTSPGTDSPSPAPTNPPSPDCWTQLDICEIVLETTLEYCNECETVTEDTETTVGETLFPDTIEMDTVDLDEETLEEIDWWTQSKMEESGYNADLGIMVVDNEFVVPLKDAYVRTCVAYGDSVNGECDSSDLVCAGTGGETYGYGSQMWGRLETAMMRDDQQNGECPVGCTEFSGWWNDLFESKGLPRDRFCTVTASTGVTAVYYVDEDGLKHNTCVGFSEGAVDNCDNSELVCSGISDGYVTYGNPNDIAESLVVAYDSVSDEESQAFMHPQCPQCCGCN